MLGIEGTLSAIEAQPIRPRSTRLRTFLITIARYLLGLAILTYGISKLLNLQFQVSSWTYAHPLIKTSGSMLTWAFLGYQPWFQFLLGVFETVPGLLLLSRRTWRLGALLLFPVLLNVVLINYALELWRDTRIISSVLLLLNLFLLACDLPMYRSFLAAMLPAPTPFQNRRVHVMVTVVAVLVPVLAMGAFWVFAMMPANRTMAEVADFVGTRQINGAGTWGVDRIAIAGQDIPGAPDRRLHFDIFMKCGYKSGMEESLGTYTASRSGHSVTISGLSLGGDSSPIAATYALQDKVLKIEGLRSGQPVVIVLHRLNWGPMLPFGR
jgi:uncharacterized membrane protein YphA (DoxX/SURF4 family)